VKRIPIGWTSFACSLCLSEEEILQYTVLFQGKAPPLSNQPALWLIRPGLLRKKKLNFATVTFSFLFGNYYLIID